MELNVVTFNIRCADDPEGHAIAQRAPRLKAVLDACDADVIGLQEGRPAWMPYLENDYPAYELYNVWRDTSDWWESAPLLWKRARFDCVDKGHFWLSDTPEVESGKEWDTVYHCKRICVWAKLRDKATGETVLAMNTHFGFGDEGQVKSAALIAARAQGLGDLPTVLTGDFNMEPTFPAYAEMTRHFRDMNPGDERITFHGYGKAKAPSHIDYCFAKGRVTPTAVRLLDETFAGKYPSDHYGLYFTLKI